MENDNKKCFNQKNAPERLTHTEIDFSLQKNAHERIIRPENQKNAPPERFFGGAFYRKTPVPTRSNLRCTISTTFFRLPYFLVAHRMRC